VARVTGGVGGSEAYARIMRGWVCSSQHQDVFKTCVPKAALERPAPCNPEALGAAWVRGNGRGEARRDMLGCNRQVIPYDEALEHTVFALANDMLKDICQVCPLACFPCLTLQAPSVGALQRPPTSAQTEEQSGEARTALRQLHAGLAPPVACCGASRVSVAPVCLLPLRAVCLQCCVRWSAVGHSVRQGSGKQGSAKMQRLLLLARRARC
jgi:hypothetical protein